MPERSNIMDIWRNLFLGLRITLSCFILSFAVNPSFAQWSHDSTSNTPISTGPATQYSPAIVSDGAGGAIITWYDFRSGAYDIYAQRVSSSGVVQWTAD